MNPVNLQELLPVSMKAAKAACEEIMDVYNADSFETEYKDDSSPLTIADKRAHTRIVKILNEGLAFPVLSEEGKNIPYETRKEWKHFWLVDPLDGTKEFIRKNGEFTVNIAFVSEGKAVLGVVAVPVTGDIYYGGPGLGAFIVKEEQSFQLVSRDRKLDLQRPGLRVVASRAHMNQGTQQFISTLKEPKLISVGSSLKFMLLATGKADIYPRFGPTMEWDTAAAQAIVEALGIHVLEKGTTCPLRYNKSSLLNPDFVSY